MKYTLKQIRAVIYAVLVAPFVVLARSYAPAGADACNIQGTHEGVMTRTAEGAIGEYLVLSFGTAPASQVRVCTASTRPIGFAYDEAASGAPIGVILTCGGNTQIAIASKAIPAGVRVFATAGGKVTDAIVSGSWLVGESLTAAAGDNSEFTILPLSPIVTP